MSSYYIDSKLLHETLTQQLILNRLTLANDMGLSAVHQDFSRATTEL